MRSLAFDAAALDDLTWWVKHDQKKALRILELVQAVGRDPLGGVGKPEPLKCELAGCWSRRIDAEHRLVYQIKDAMIRILSCRYH